MLPGAINSKRQQKQVTDRLLEGKEKVELIEQILELEETVLSKIKSQRLRDIGAFIFLVVVVVLIIVGNTGCSASIPHLVNLTVETAPPADIYFDGLLVGSGSTRIHMFSDLIPNYLEIRDIITGETLSRILLHKIPDLQVLSLRYKSETRRDERMKIIQSLIEAENIVNGQPPADARLMPGVDQDPLRAVLTDY